MICLLYFMKVKKLKKKTKKKKINLSALLEGNKNTGCQNL